MATHRFVPHLTDLIHPEDYGDDLEGRRLRLRIRATGDGLELLGDAMRPAELEALLDALGAEEIEQMLCG